MSIRQLKSAIVSHWPNMSVLVGAQGIGIITNVLYGKLIAIYVSPGVFGLYSVQLATLMLFHGLFITPSIQAYMSALQQGSFRWVNSFYRKVLAITYGMGFLASSMAYFMYGQPKIVYAFWLVACFQGYYLQNVGYIKVYGYHRIYATLQTISALLSLVLLALSIAGKLNITVNILWVLLLILNVVLAGVSVYFLRRKYAIERHLGNLGKPLRKQYWLYASPLFIQAIFSWVSNYIDRYFLEYLTNSKEVGYYSTAYSIGSKILLIANPLLVQLTAQLFALNREKEAIVKSYWLIKRYLYILWGICTTLCLGLYVFNEPLGLFLLSEQYRPAFVIMPLIAIAYTFLCSTQLVETAFYTFNRTRYIMIHSCSGALINVGLDVWLIPEFGATGAAFATIGSMVVQFVIAAYLFTLL